MRRKDNRFLKQCPHCDYTCLMHLKRHLERHHKNAYPNPGALKAAAEEAMRLARSRSRALKSEVIISIKGGRAKFSARSGAVELRHCLAGEFVAVQNLNVSDTGSTDNVLYCFSCDDLRQSWRTISI